MKVKIHFADGGFLALSFADVDERLHKFLEWFKTAEAGSIFRLVDTNKTHHLQKRNVTRIETS